MKVCWSIERTRSEEMDNGKGGDMSIEPEFT